MRNFLLKKVMQYPDYWVEIRMNDGDVYIRPCASLHSARTKAGLMYKKYKDTGMLEVKDCMFRAFCSLHLHIPSVTFINRIAEISVGSIEEEK